MDRDEDNNHKGFKIFIIVVLISIMFLITGENKEKLIGVLNSINNNIGLELVNSFNIDENMIDINIYDNTIVKWENNKLIFYKLDGSRVMDKEFNFEDPFVYYGTSHIYVADRNTGHIYSLDNKGDTINRIELGKQLLNLKETNGNLICHGRSEDFETIDIFNNKGVKIEDYVYETENLLAYSTNEDGIGSSVAMINIDGEVISSQIVNYGENKEELGEVKIDGEIVVYLECRSKDEVLALTESGLYFIKGDNIIWEKKFNLVKDIYMNEKKIYILHGDELETIDFKGKSIEKIKFTEEYKKILPFEDYVLAYGEKDMVIIEGNKKIIEKKDDIIEVHISENNILVVGKEDIKTYRIGRKE